jgi:hypothetical protein
MIDLSLDMAAQLSQRIRRAITAKESIHRPIAWERVQEGLPHRELVQVRIEQRANDGRESSHGLRSTERRVLRTGSEIACAKATVSC